MESYKWIYNFIILSLYSCCIATIYCKEFDINNQDVLFDFKALESLLFGRIDPSIRHHLQKRGISIKENTYIGFDTEFNNRDIETNFLVSAQLAVTNKTFVHIPRATEYKLSQIEEQSNKLRILNRGSKGFNYNKLEASISKCIAAIRKMKYKNHDNNMLIVTECLRIIKGISYFEHPDYTVFSLPRSKIQPYIQYGGSFSMKQIVDIASSLSKNDLRLMNNKIRELIQNISDKHFSVLEGRDKLKQEIYKVFGDYNDINSIRFENENAKPLPLISVEPMFQTEKRLSRSYLFDVFDQKLSITNTKWYYIIAHLTPADLSLLTDFNELKEDLNIVNGSFVTIGKPLNLCGKNVHIRDTMLLAPGAGKSLASIGKLYSEEWNKVKISKVDLENMQSFLHRDKEKFTEYAIKDALISLIHASWMEEFNFKIGGLGVPLSLSSIGRRYVKNNWKDSDYKGYQVSQKYLLGDVASTITPKGLNVVKNIGFVLPYYIANYKGGRNECFMYGIDRDSEWFDYDLSSAYTTVMAMAGHPDYSKTRRMSVPELLNLTNEELVYNYLIINAYFEFPYNTKYPSIPCSVDENCTVYPLKGNCVLTGSEYYLAKSQGCVFNIQDVYFTPFRRSDYNDPKPFTSIIQLVQAQRREYPKGSISNLMYKEIGNSIYGSVVRGLGNKRKFDIKSNGTVRMSGDDLTNPLIASWTTAFVRSIIGECLHSIQLLGGLVVSVTTDGFICNIKDLENKISENLLLKTFTNTRMELADERIGLELKTQGKGIIAWSTRGQIGLESNILATTGFQNRNYKDPKGKKELVDLLVQTMKSEHKTIEFIQSRLRSATEIFKKGGHVTMQLRDQLFRLFYDNRRMLQWETTIPATSEVLIDSLPLITKDKGENLRFISSLHKKKLYGKYTSVGNKRNKYINNEEIAVRNFLKGLLATPPLFNLSSKSFLNTQGILDFINNYNDQWKYDKGNISCYKTREVMLLKLQKTKETEAFVKYVKETFSSFDEEAFYTMGN